MLYFTPEMDRAGLMDRFLQLLPHTESLGCRTLDIVHVAAAAELRVERFVSFDSRQLQLAELAGLRCERLAETANPGGHTNR